MLIHEVYLLSFLHQLHLRQWNSKQFSKPSHFNTIENNEHLSRFCSRQTESKNVTQH